MTLLFATPAFGLRALILDFVGGRTSVSFVKSRPAPAEIKKRFLDLAIGAPAGMNPHVLPDEARQITFRGPAGGKRVLWVAPTRGGGFCAQLVGAGGGCSSKASEQLTGPVTIGGAFSEKPGEPLRIIEVDGHVYSAKITTLTLEFEDGTSMPVSFVYVSDPINAGIQLSSYVGGTLGLGGIALLAPQFGSPADVGTTGTFVFHYRAFEYKVATSQERKLANIQAQHSRVGARRRSIPYSPTNPPPGCVRPFGIFYKGHRIKTKPGAAGT